MTMSTTQRVDDELRRQLQAFSEATGVPVSRCINEAIKMWLANVAPGRLEALTIGNETAVSKMLDRLRV